MGTPGEEQDAPWGQGTDGPTESVHIDEDETCSALADPILLRWEWSTFVPPWQQKFIDALDAFRSTLSYFFIQQSVTWKCRLKAMKTPEWDRGEGFSSQHSRDGVCRTKFKGFSRVWSHLKPTPTLPLPQPAESTFLLKREEGWSSIPFFWQRPCILGSL